MAKFFGPRVNHHMVTINREVPYMLFPSSEGHQIVERYISLQAIGVQNVL